jgi:hypothetical protein
MKTYPHIEYYSKEVLDKYIYVFEKYDGQNFRAEFSVNTRKL